MSIPSHNDNIKKTAGTHQYTLHYDIMKKTAGTCLYPLQYYITIKEVLHIYNILL